jgi:hypothetical protein
MLNTTTFVLNQSKIFDNLHLAISNNKFFSVICWLVCTKNTILINQYIIHAFHVNFYNVSCHTAAPIYIQHHLIFLLQTAKGATLMHPTTGENVIDYATKYVNYKTDMLNANGCQLHPSLNQPKQEISYSNM